MSSQPDSSRPTLGGIFGEGALENGVLLEENPPWMDFPFSPGGRKAPAGPIFEGHKAPPGPDLQGPTVDAPAAGGEGNQLVSSC